MWECPTCKRSFKKINQSHYCQKPQTVDEYIQQQPENIQQVLIEMREILKQANPQAQEKISWSMPTYWCGQNIIQFAGFKHHISLYPGAEAIETYQEELQAYPTSKGTLQFPYGQPLPKELIKDIACWCFKQYAIIKD